MTRIEPTKKYLLAKRAGLMLDLRNEGYSLGDIATMFNFDHTSTVKRIIDSYEKTLTTNQ